MREDPAIAAFERLFRERGLPFAIRSDNGVPFASPNALFNLSKLSVWWLRLGIAIEVDSKSEKLLVGTQNRDARSHSAGCLQDCCSTIDGPRSGSGGTPRTHHLRRHGHDPCSW
jgi:hypothetical protein